MRRPSLRGDELPDIRVPPPGPRSRAAVRRLRAAEGAAIWGSDPWPIVWSKARGSVVEDVDGNRYVDLTSGFGAAFLGHAATEVARAVSSQARRLPQGLGDLHPHPMRERLVRALASGGGSLSRVLLASTGSEAVELALQTAALATGRRRVVAFEGSYHGLLGRARAVTHHPSQPPALLPGERSATLFLPFPDPPRCPVRQPCAGCDLACLEQGFEQVDRALRAEDPPGAVIVEPIQGRAGVVIPPPAFLPRLCALARARGLLVVYDEVLTGAGRTGRLWAWEHAGPEAEPDLLAAGKALGGGAAIAAVLGRPAIMEAWSAAVGPTGESPHASTYYAHPLACAASLATLGQIADRIADGRIERAGSALRSMLELRPPGRHGPLEVRAAGLLLGVSAPTSHRAELAGPASACRRLLGRGVLAIPSGRDGSTIMLLPACTISEAQLECSALELREWI